jgi:Argonaute siRNA chaperone (ARC) complex subunit Arb1
MELCIQRYRARRKFDSVRSNIFTKYLVLGGVDSGVKAFNGGLDEGTLEASTAAEIAEIGASDYIRSGSIKFYNTEDPNWVIDFEGVAKGFL